MFMPVISGLVVSLDAFFIGLSLGLQKKCKFLYLAVINAFLFMLCIIGFLIAERIYELISIDTDIVVGFLFISLGIWYLLQYFVFECFKVQKKDEAKETASSIKKIIPVGVVMSVEAMLITMGITFIFLPASNLIIPLTVALAHFGYSTLSFLLARTEYAKKIPVVFSHIISGVALIIYGLLALFVDFGV